MIIGREGRLKEGGERTDTGGEKKVIMGGKVIRKMEGKNKDRG